MGPDAFSGAGKVKILDSGEEFEGIGGVLDGDVNVGGEGKFENGGEDVREAAEFARGSLVNWRISVEECCDVAFG